MDIHHAASFLEAFPVRRGVITVIGEALGRALVPAPCLSLGSEPATGAAQPLAPVVVVADREEPCALPAPNQKEHVVHAHPPSAQTFWPERRRRERGAPSAGSPLADPRAWEVETQALFYFARSPAL